jgi:hypothetical protein
MAMKFAGQGGSGDRPLPQVADPWLSSKGAATYLGVEVGTLAKWRQRGIGPRYSCALGRDPRYLLTDLAAFMESSVATNTIQARTLRKSIRSSRLEFN